MCRTNVVCITTFSLRIVSTRGKHRVEKWRIEAARIQHGSAASVVVAAVAATATAAAAAAVAATAAAAAAAAAECRIGVTSQPSLAPLSPFLNFDPSYLPVSQPEFIFPDGALKQRGRFELAFSQIGAACITGAGIGGTSGLYRGIKATSIAGETGKLRRTQLINYVMKGGASMANSLGVITIMYTCAGIGLTWLRGTDDSFNTVAAAATSAMVFRSPAGVRKAGIAGAIAAGVAVIYCAWNNGGLSLQRMNGWKHPA